LVNAPDGYVALLGDLPNGADVVEGLAEPVEFIQFFTRERLELEANFPILKESITPAGMVWISWPKRASKVPTDLDENSIREIGLRNGLVDVKVIAVDETWSGLKFVYRLADRA
jgi:hypothetical protein